MDNDLYKFTMQQIVLHQYPDAKAQYRFVNRGKHKFNKNFLNKLHVWIEEEAVSYILDEGGEEESSFLRKLPFIQPWYVEYLKNYTFNPAQVKIALNNGDLDLSIEGPWHETILWEVPLMAAISEIYFSEIEAEWNFSDWRETQTAKIEQKAIKLGEAKFADFGTRRRRSSDIQDLIVKTAKQYGNFVGTSNVFLAYKHGIKPIGTMAHEWVQAISALESLNHANRYMMEKWAGFYSGSLGIALTDTYGLRAFLVDFSPRLAKLFDGIRHDSGCPFELTDRIVSLYKNYGIDPSSKTIVFSDGLDVNKAVKIHEYCKKLGIRCSFGIGTNLTNDFENSQPLNMVIKLWNINGMPVVKVSEDASKSIGDTKAIQAIRTIYGL